MGNWRKSIEADILTTWLAGITFEGALFVSVDGGANCHDDEETEDEIYGVPELAHGGGVDADVFGETVEDVPHFGRIMKLTGT